MAKKKQFKPKGTIESTDDVLATLASMEMNQAKNDPEALRRLKEISEAVKVQNTELKKQRQSSIKPFSKSGLLKTPSTVNSKDLADYDLTFLLESKDIDLSKPFKVSRSGAGKFFIQQNKVKIELVLSDNTFVEKPLPEPTVKKKETVKKKPPASKGKKKPKKPSKPKTTATKAAPADFKSFEKESFSFSKDRLIQELETEMGKQKNLEVKEISVSEIKTKLKTFSNSKQLYRFANQQITIIKNNLQLKLKGQRLSDAASFVADNLIEILVEGKNSNEASEKKDILKRLENFVKNIEKKILKESINSVTEQEFLEKLTVLVINTVQQDIKISTSLRSKLGAINFSDSFEKLTDAVSTFNPFAGVLLSAAGKAISASGKLAGKMFKSGAKNLIDSDLDNFFDFQENQRKEQIRQSSKKESILKKKIDGKSNSPFDDDFSDIQQEHSEHLSDIKDILQDTKETDLELLQQQKDWKRQEEISLSKERIAEKNSNIASVFPATTPKQTEKKPGILGAIFGSKGGSEGGGSGVSFGDIFTGTFWSGLAIGAIKKFGAFALTAFKGIGKILFSKLVPNLIRTALVGLGKIILGIAGGPVLLGALAAAGIGYLAYEFKDEIWDVIKKLFTVISKPIKKAITYVADKLMEVKDLIVGKGKEFFTDAKDFFKKTFSIFGSSPTDDMDKELKRLEGALKKEREKLENSVRLASKKTVLPMLNKRNENRIQTSKKKITELETDIARTKNQIIQKNSSRSFPNTFGGIGAMTALSESNNDAGRVSTGIGDHGGKSYGIYQFASKPGTLQEFLKHSGYDKILSKYKIGSVEFDNAWKELGRIDPNFAQAQHDFIQNSHYGPLMTKLQNNGLDFENRSDALKSVVFSSATQYRKLNIIPNALSGKDVSKMSDEDIIASIQDYKMRNLDSTHVSSSAAVRRGVANRISREKHEAISRARNERLLAGGKERTTQMASNSVVNNNVMQSGGSSGRQGGLASTRNNESTYQSLQMQSMRGTPLA